jgi:hypothetical protein
MAMTAFWMIVVCSIGVLALMLPIILMLRAMGLFDRTPHPPPPPPIEAFFRRGHEDETASGQRG